MEKPKVLNYAKAYSAFLLIIYLCAAIAYPLIIFSGAGSDPTLSESEATNIATFGTILTLAFIAPFIIFTFSNLFLINVKKKWNFYLQVVFFALGCGSLLTIVPCIFLLINWFKDDVKEYYGLEV